MTPARKPGLRFQYLTSPGAVDTELKVPLNSQDHFPRSRDLVARVAPCGARGPGFNPSSSKCFSTHGGKTENRLIIISLVSVQSDREP